MKKSDITLDMIESAGYRIFEDGRVWSEAKTWINGKGGTVSIPDRFLKQIADKNGYQRVNLYIFKKLYTFLVHRLVCMKHSKDYSDSLQVDHIDHDRKNNNINNLRMCSHQENHCNRKSNNNSSSKYKGVSWDKLCRKWKAQIVYNSKFIYIGCFENEIDAAKAYNEKAKCLFGEFACLNILGKD